jgi:hypothetical protein
MSGNFLQIKQQHQSVTTEAASIPMSGVSESSYKELIAVTTEAASIPMSGKKK